MDATHEELSAAIQRHLARFGGEYVAQVGPSKIVQLELDGGITLVVIAVTLAETRDRVLAVVLPDEQAEGERAVGQLRRFLQRRAR